MSIEASAFWQVLRGGLDSIIGSRNSSFTGNITQGKTPSLVKSIPALTTTPIRELFWYLPFNGWKSSVWFDQKLEYVCSALPTPVSHSIIYRSLIPKLPCFTTRPREMQWLSGWSSVIGQSESIAHSLSRCYFNLGCRKTLVCREILKDKEPTEQRQAPRTFRSLP